MDYFNNFFPYIPYESQKLFIKNIIETLDHKKVGIFESPTGTGKSLTLLSGVMEFLRKKNSEGNSKQVGEEEFDWLKSFGNPKKKKRNYTEFNEKDDVQMKIFKIDSEQKVKENLDEYVLDVNQIKFDNLENKEEESDKIQVLFCTRTHSQITQIMSEIKKIKEKVKDFEFKCVSIGSRKHLCINNSVRKLENLNRINEKCIDMIKKDKLKCPFNTNIETLSNVINDKLLDIEEIYKLGFDMRICPYYGTKNTVSNSDIIIIPYNQVLHSNLRKSLKINLKNKIIIFDEAHNLIDSLLNLYSSEITLEKTFCLFLQLNFYYEKFKEKLKSINNLLIRQLMRVVESLLIFFINENIQSNKFPLIINISDFLFKCQLNDIEFFKLRDFIEKAELINKVDWFFESILKDSNKFQKEYDNFLKDVILKHQTISKYFNKEGETIREKFSSLKTFCLYFEKGFINNFSDFLRSITYLDDDGKICIDKGESK